MIAVYTPYDDPNRKPNFAERLKSLWAGFLNWWESTRLGRKVFELFVHFTRTSLLLRCFMFSAMAHAAFFSFPQMVEKEPKPMPKEQMVEIRIGTEIAEAEAPAPQTAPPQQAVAEPAAAPEPLPQPKRIARPKPQPQLKPKPVAKVQPEQEMAAYAPTAPPQPAVEIPVLTRSDKYSAAKPNGATYGNKRDAGKISPEDYLARLQHTVQEMSYVPPEANGLRAMAILRLRFNREGYVTSYELRRPTGYKLLDDAALDVARRLTSQPFPPAPDGFDRGENSMQYDFVIHYPSQN